MFGRGMAGSGADAGSAGLPTGDTESSAGHLGGQKRDAGEGTPGPAGKDRVTTGIRRDPAVREDVAVWLSAGGGGGREIARSAGVDLAALEEGRSASEDEIDVAGDRAV